MGKFDNGVTEYTIANLDMNVYFPGREFKCRWCPFVRHNDGINRDKCALTEKILYSLEITGLNCPLKPINTIDAEELK